MSIKIKRNTGFIGGASKISLSVDGQKVTKLKYNEEYVIEANDEPTKIKVSQLYFGSSEVEVEAGDFVEVKINSIALVLFYIFFVLLIAGFLYDQILTIIGGAFAIILIIYSVKNWFTLDVQKQFKVE